jgi:hypothetical protein
MVPHSLVPLHSEDDPGAHSVGGGINDMRRRDTIRSSPSGASARRPDTESSGTAGAVLSRLGTTDLNVYCAIQDSTPAPSPTAARTRIVYLPVGKSIFKNGAKVCPDLPPPKPTLRGDRAVRLPAEQ